MEGAKKLPWGISNKELMPSSLGQITDSKLAAFAGGGGQKKSRFQKAREGITYIYTYLHICIYAYRYLYIYL